MGPSPSPAGSGVIHLPRVGAVVAPPEKCPASLRVIALTAQTPWRERLCGGGAATVEERLFAVGAIAYDLGDAVAGGVDKSDEVAVVVVNGEIGAAANFDGDGGTDLSTLAAAEEAEGGLLA